MSLSTKLFRFVNTVSDSKLNEKVIWNFIKVIRLEFLKKNGNVRCEASDDPDENSFIDEQEMENNLEKLSQMVQVIGSDQSNKNLSKAAINVGAEMFVALNSCPSYHVKLYWNVIYGPESRIAVLALKIVKKANSNFKKDALKIFSKICSVLGKPSIKKRQKKLNFFNSGLPPPPPLLPKKLKTLFLI